MPIIKANLGGIRTYTGFENLINRDKRKQIKAYKEVFLTEKELSFVQPSTYTIVKEKSSPKPEPAPEPVAEPAPKEEVKDKGIFNKKN